jgi:dCMP deaminase
MATGAAIFTPEYQLLTTGYNGSPRNTPHCDEAGCLIVQGSCRRAVHAEMNAITQASRLGIKLCDGVLFSTHRPCIICSNLIVQAGIRTVYWEQQYLTDGEEGYAFVRDLFGRTSVNFWQLKAA